MPACIMLLLLGPLVPGANVRRRHAQANAAEAPTDEQALVRT